MSSCECLIPTPLVSLRIGLVLLLAFMVLVTNNGWVNLPVFEFVKSIVTKPVNKVGYEVDSTQPEGCGPLDMRRQFFHL